MPSSKHCEAEHPAISGVSCSLPSGVLNGRTPDKVAPLGPDTEESPQAARRVWRYIHVHEGHDSSGATHRWEST